MFKNAFGLRYTYLDAGGARDLSNFEKAIFVIDNPLKRAMNKGDIINTSNQSDTLPDDMRTIGSFEESSSGSTNRDYPYASMRQNFWSDSVEVKATD